MMQSLHLCPESLPTLNASASVGKYLVPEEIIPAQTQMRNALDGSVNLVLNVQCYTQLVMPWSADTVT